MKRILLLLLFFAFLIGCNSEQDNESNKNKEKDDNEKTEEVGKPDKEKDDNEKTEEVGKPDKEKDDNEKTEEVGKPDNKELENAMQEVSDFVKEFNQLASSSDNLEPLSDSEELDENDAQLLTTTDEYGIVAEYKDDELSNYSIVFFKEDSYKELSGNGVNAMIIVAETLNLDTDELLKKFEESLSKEVNVYFEDDYSVMFFNKELTEDTVFGIVVTFAEIFN